MRRLGNGAHTSPWMACGYTTIATTISTVPLALLRAPGMLAPFLEIPLKSRAYQPTLSQYL
jgi:hypothetical protein